MNITDLDEVNRLTRDINGLDEMAGKLERATKDDVGMAVRVTAGSGYGEILALHYPISTDLLPVIAATIQRERAQRLDKLRALGVVLDPPAPPPADEMEAPSDVGC